MTQRPGRIVLTVVLVALAMAGSASTEERYHGRVVDADTNEPLPGAVVIVIWSKRPIVSMNGVSFFHDVREAMTDAEGRFSIQAKPGWNLNPFRTVTRHPEIVVYKPGYGPFRVAYTRLERLRPRDLRAMHETLLARRAAMIPIPKLMTEAELRMFADVELYPHVPLGRVPIYVGLVNEQRARVGLEPLPGSDVQSRLPGDR